MTTDQGSEAPQHAARPTGAEVLTASDLARHYDAHYFQTYHGGAYVRGEPWLSAFAGMADGIVREIRPGSALDVGCAIGLLVEALRERGVEAHGVDVSEYAIGQVHDDVKPYCRVGSLLDAPTGRYDLVVCYEVLEHLPPEDADRAVGNLCQLSEDILFSSSADEFDEDTHVNARPMAYWAGLFAKHGFIRDVEFDPIGVHHKAAVRFRRTAEPPHRIVAGFERMLWRLSQENADLRLRALETRQRMSEQARALAEKATATADVAALELTIAEQTVHLDAQAERLRFMSDRESDLRALLHDAHEQLLKRDEDLVPMQRELTERAKVIDELDRVLKERTAWAERTVAEAEERGRVIDDLQRALDEQHAAVTAAVMVQQDLAALRPLVDERTAWAERLVAEAEARGRVIDDLQRLVDERTAWAERMVAEAEARGRVIESLQRQLQERDRLLNAARQGMKGRRDVSKEALAVAARLDRRPVRLLVRGYRRLRRLV